MSMNIKKAIYVPKIAPEMLELLTQLKLVHQEFGDYGALKFLEDTEKRSNLAQGTLSDLMLFVKKSD